MLRQEGLFPEIELAGRARGVFEVEQVRRREGRESTSIGAAVEDTIVGLLAEDAEVTRPRPAPVAPVNLDIDMDPRDRTRFDEDVAARPPQVDPFVREIERTLFPERFQIEEEQRGLTSETRIATIEAMLGIEPVEFDDPRSGITTGNDKMSRLRTIFEDLGGGTDTRLTTMQRRRVFELMTGTEPDEMLGPFGLGVWPDTLAFVGSNALRALTVPLIPEGTLPGVLDPIATEASRPITVIAAGTPVMRFGSSFARAFPAEVAAGLAAQEAAERVGNEWLAWPAVLGAGIIAGGVFSRGTTIFEEATRIHLAHETALRRAMPKAFEYGRTQGDDAIARATVIFPENAFANRTPGMIGGGGVDDPLTFIRRPSDPGESLQRHGYRDRSQRIAPSAIEQRLWGFEPIVSGLSRSDITFNIASWIVNFPFRSIGKQVATARHALVDPAFRVFARQADNIDSIANYTMATAERRMRQAFRFSDDYRLPDLDGVVDDIVGAPTLQDVAERLPLYASRLTDDQIQIIRDLDKDFSGFRAALTERGDTFIPRPSVMEGGIELPRGRRMRPGEVEPIAVRNVSIGTTIAPDNAHSMANAMNSRMQFAPPWEATGTYVRQLGARNNALYLTDYFKSLTDANGKPLYTTPKTRLLEGDFADKEFVQGFRELQGRMDALQRAGVRLRGRQANAINSFLYDPMFEDIDDVIEQFGRVRVDDLVIRDVFPLTALPERNKLAEIVERLEASLPRTPTGRISVSAANRNAVEQLGRVRALMFVRMALESHGGRLSDIVDELALESSQAIDIATRARPRQIPDASAYAETLTGWVDIIRAGTRDEQVEVAFDAFNRQMRAALDPVIARGERAGMTLADINRSVEQIQNLIKVLRPRYKLLLRESQRAGPGENVIQNVWPLQGLAFPTEISNAANAIIRRIGGDEDIVTAINNMQRAMTATLDDSGPGIQGLMGFYDRPDIFAKAFMGHYGVARSPEAFGKFLLRFDEMARLSHRSSAVDWARSGLRIGGTDTEFMVKGLGQLPVIGVPIDIANRMFGAFGDMYRLQWADAMLEQELRGGRSLSEIKASGDMRRIADEANSMTGYSQRHFGGRFGQIMLYAPRFFQARMEVAARALMGIPGHRTLDRRLAQRSMFRMISLGTGLTVALNFMLGNDTDFMPFRDKDGNGTVDPRVLQDGGYYNPNFLRVRAFNRDWSLFGTWDSLARVLVSSMSDNPLSGFRGLLAGVPSQTWDQLTGESLMRDPVKTPAERAAHILKSFIPFSAEEGFSGIVDAYRAGRADDPAGVLGGLATTTGEIFGLKSSLLALEDMRNEQAKVVSQGATDNYWELTEPQQREVDEEEGITRRLAELNMLSERAVKDNPDIVLDVTFRGRENNIATSENVLKRLIVRAMEDRTIDSVEAKTIAEAYRTAERDIAIANQALFSNPYVSELLTGKSRDKNLWNLWADKWHGVELHLLDEDFGLYDFRSRNEERAEILRQAVAAGVPEDYILGVGPDSYRDHKWESPEVRIIAQRMEQAERWANETGYTEIDDTAWDTVKTLFGVEQQTYDQWRLHEIDKIVSAGFFDSSVAPYDRASRHVRSESEIVAAYSDIRKVLYSDWLNEHGGDPMMLEAIRWRFIPDVRNSKSELDLIDALQEMRRIREAARQ